MARGQQVVMVSLAEAAVANGYRTAYNGAVLIDRSAEGRFELLDRDRLDLLQRMSTNDLRELGIGQGRSTVLTTALARIIDRLVLYERSDTTAAITLAVCGVGRTTTIRGWLQRHIFFQDKVQTRDVSANTCQFGMFGASSEAVAAQFAADIADLPLHHFREFTLAGEIALLARTYPLAGGGFTIIAPSAIRDTLVMAFQQSIGATNVMLGATGDAVYELLRIEAGLPLAGHELSEEYLPLEAGLWDSISFSKGCYTGQEIIARMESRHQLARTIARLTISAFVPVGSKIARASQPDHGVGVITSVATKPDGDTIALGYVKMDALDEPLVVAATADHVAAIKQLTAIGWGPNVASNS